MKKITDFLLDLLYPPKCAFCRKLLKDSEKGVCGKCGAKLPFLPEGTLIEDIPHIRACAAPLRYEGDVRQSMLRYKFGGLTAYKNIYAEFLAKCIDENAFSCDIITWVPLSRKRYRKRGYDQAELIAKAAADILGKDCAMLLEKVRDNPPQSGTGSAAQRKANAKGVYRCRDTALAEGKRILIIDDIVTTGATLSECAKILKKAGAAEIYAAAVASAHG